MFYYYGGKRQLARLYPPPTYETIVEPFAGSAAYSMFHLGALDAARSSRRIILIEKDERVVEVWHRLLAMTPDELLAYPVPAAGERTSDFLVMTAATSNAIARCKSMKVSERMPEVVTVMLRQMAQLLPTVREKVEIHHGDYTDAPDIEATWFIDPPYEVRGPATSTVYPQGMGYAVGCDALALDYRTLAAWVRGRRGQKIVCEQEGATWLPFRPLGVTHDSLGGRSSEVVWDDPEHQLRIG